MMLHGKKRPFSGRLRPGGKFQGIPGRSGRNDTKAVIDIGSNSIKLRVVRKQGDVLRTLVDTTEVVRLGKGLRNGQISEDIMRYGVSVVRRLVRLAGEMGARPRLVGTMALRVARNAPEFVRRVRERTGITVEVLSGEEEARLAWTGAIHGLAAGAGDVAVFDTGGGSTEFIFGSDAKITKAASIPIGAVRLTEKFFDGDPVKPEAVEQARQYIGEMFEVEGIFRELPSPLSVIGLGGGVAAIASVQLALDAFNPERINGTLLSRNDIDAQVELYASRTLAERMTIKGLPARRADIILASACIVQCALRALGAESFRVSINGLRHGLVIEMFDAAFSKKR